MLVCVLVGPRWRMSAVGNNGMSVITVIGWGRVQVKREGAMQVSVSAYVHV